MISYEAVIYRRMVLPAAKSEDGETPTFYLVTKEASGYAVWKTSASDIDSLIRFYHGVSAREDAIELAADLVRAFQREGRS